MSVRVVIDTSTLVGAALRPGSLPHRALQATLASCELCASTETLAELDTVLGRAKFDRYLGRPERREFVSLVRRNARIFVVQDHDARAVTAVCRDSADDKFLALAVAARANILVASDDDLLVLDLWREIAIVTPREFLDRRGAGAEEATGKADAQ